MMITIWGPLLNCTCEVLKIPYVCNLFISLFTKLHLAHDTFLFQAAHNYFLKFSNHTDKAETPAWARPVIINHYEKRISSLLKSLDFARFKRCGMVYHNDFLRKCSTAEPITLNCNILYRLFLRILTRGKTIPKLELELQEPHLLLFYGDMGNELSDLDKLCSILQKILIHVRV